MTKMVVESPVGISPVRSSPGAVRQVSGVAVGGGRVGRGVAVTVGGTMTVGVGGGGAEEGRQAGSPIRSARQAKARIV